MNTHSNEAQSKAGEILGSIVTGKVVAEQTKKHSKDLNKKKKKHQQYQLLWLCVSGTEGQQQ